MIAATTHRKISDDFSGGESFDLVVASGSACGPSTRAALDGLGRLAVMLDPPIVALRDKSPAIKRYLDELPLEEFMDSVAADTGSHADELVAGRPGEALEAAFGQKVQDARERRFLDLGKQVMEQRMPFDDALTGSAGDEGRQAADWSTPWAQHPDAVRLMLSRPASAVVEGLRELVPTAQVMVCDWPAQPWVHAPEAVAAALVGLGTAR